MNRTHIVYALGLVGTIAVVGIGSTLAHNYSGPGVGTGEKGPYAHEAHRANAEERIGELVASGELTQEEADAKFEFFAERDAMREEHQKEFAEFLGVSTEELDASRADGISIIEFAAAQGISEEELQAFHQKEMTEHMTERLADLVESGALTQEEADEKLTLMQERVANGDKPGFGMKSHRGFGGHMKGFGMHLGR